MVETVLWNCGNPETFGLASAHHCLSRNELEARGGRFCVQECRSPGLRPGSSDCKSYAADNAITNEDLNCPFNRLAEVATGFEALIVEPRNKRRAVRYPEQGRDIENIARAAEPSTRR
jgi:hypothetical protein